MSDGKLADLQTPKLVELQLTNGKVAKIGSITLGALVTIEEKYGSFEAWQKKISGAKDGGAGVFLAMGEVFWLLCQNKSDVVPLNVNKEERVQHFLDVLPVENLSSLADMLQNVLGKSMPAAQASGGRRKSAAAKK